MESEKNVLIGDDRNFNSRKNWFLSICQNRQIKLFSKKFLPQLVVTTLLSDKRFLALLWINKLECLTLANIYTLDWRIVRGTDQGVVL